MIDGRDDFPPSAGNRRAGLARRIVVTVAIGVAAGLSGVLVALLLRVVQHVAYDYPAGRFTFLEGVASASPSRRFVALCVAGVVAAVGWWVLDRHGRPRMRIEQALAVAPPRMPLITTLVHAALQVVTVALGSPLGREVAPREMAAALAGRLTAAARIAGPDARVLVACAAGAGLAAVYNVPFAGVFFTMEALLRSFAWRPLVAAIVTTAIATGVSRLCLGDVMQYDVSRFDVDESLLAWSLVVGPLIGLVAFAFRRAGEAARPRRPRHDGSTIVLSLVVFATLGLLAGPFPELLGNGKGPAQLGFDGAVTAQSALVLFALKAIVVFATIRAGAYGGLLTPGIACGALLATALGGAWSSWWPGPATGAYALVGATVFLAVSMAMPCTAIVLLFEMTGMAPVFFVPIAVCFVGAKAVSHVCTKRWPQRDPARHT